MIGKLVFVACALFSGVAFGGFPSFVQHEQTPWFRYFTSSGVHDGNWYFRDATGTLHLHKQAVQAAAVQKDVVKEVVKEVAKVVPEKQVDVIQVVPELGAGYVSKDVWRAELLKLVADRERYAIEANRAASDQYEFLEAIRVLGLPGEVQKSGGGHYGGGSYGGYKPTGYGLNGYGNANAFAFRDYGNSVYGYTYNSIAQPVDDPATLAQHALRLADHFQDSSARVGIKAVEAAERVSLKNAEFRERAAAAARSCLECEKVNRRPVEQSPLQQHSSYSTRDPYQAKKVQPADDEDIRFRVKTTFSNSCVECHHPGRKGGGLDLSLMGALSPKTIRDIVRVVNSDDPSERMPKGRRPLTDEQRQAIEAWANTVAQ